MIATTLFVIKTITNLKNKKICLSPLWKSSKLSKTTSKQEIILSPEKMSGPSSKMPRLWTKVLRHVWSQCVFYSMKNHLMRTWNSYWRTLLKPSNKSKNMIQKISMERECSSFNNALKLQSMIMKIWVNLIETLFQSEIGSLQLKITECVLRKIIQLSPKKLKLQLLKLQQEKWKFLQRKLLSLHNTIQAPVRDQLCNLLQISTKWHWELLNMKNNTKNLNIQKSTLNQDLIREPLQLELLQSSQHQFIIKLWPHQQREAQIEPEDTKMKLLITNLIANQSISRSHKLNMHHLNHQICMEIKFMFQN